MQKSRVKLNVWLFTSSNEFYKVCKNYKNFKKPPRISPYFINRFKFNIKISLDSEIVLIL